MKKTLFLISIVSLIWATPVVKVVSNFDVDPKSIEALIGQQQVKARVEISNLSEYEPSLIRNRTKWGRFLRKCGLDFPKSIALEEEVSKVIFYNTTVRYWRNLSLQKLPKDQLILFMWEPPNVLHQMYRQRLHAKFGRIYTWDDGLVDHKTYFKFNYPVLQPMIDEVVPFEEKKLCTLVATYIQPKFPNSLYGERVKAIEFFERVGESGFEFYGRGWDPKRFKSYQGPIKDKIGAIKNYKFSICYENSTDILGYITEKIFDCFAAGTVPVYWGASNVCDYIPKECFIDRRDFASLEELHAFLKAMDQKTYEGYLANIRRYLLSEKAQQFSSEAFAKTLASAIAS